MQVLKKIYSYNNFLMNAQYKNVKCDINSIKCYGKEKVNFKVFVYN